MDDFPEPETPVKIVICRLGTRSEMSFRLFSRAPRMSMNSFIRGTVSIAVCRHRQGDVPRRWKSRPTRCSLCEPLDQSHDEERDSTPSAGHDSLWAAAGVRGLAGRLASTSDLRIG